MFVLHCRVSQRHWIYPSSTDLSVCLSSICLSSILRIIDLNIRVTSQPSFRRWLQAGVKHLQMEASEVTTGPSQPAGFLKAATVKYSGGHCGQQLLELFDGWESPDLQPAGG